MTERFCIPGNNARAFTAMQLLIIYADRFYVPIGILNTSSRFVPVTVYLWASEDNLLSLLCETFRILLIRHNN